MSDDKGLLDRLKQRGEEVFTQLSGELMSNRHFMKAMEGAMRGKQKLDEAAARALKTMNVPTRTEFKKAVGRIETLEEELASLRARMKTASRRQGRRPEKPRAKIDDGPDRRHGHLVVPGRAHPAPPGRDPGRTDAVVAVDIAAPPATLGVRHRMVDLTLPGADQRLVDVLGEEEVDTVVHAAFFTNPRRDAAYSHELESIGTLHLAAAAAAAGVSHFVLRSFTAVYGARGQNPNFLTEEHSPQPPPALAWARDKREAEEHAASFARRYPSLGLTVLRFAFLFGPGRPHLLHADLQQARGAGAHGLRPAPPAPSPRGRAGRGGGGAGARPERSRERRPRAARCRS